MRGDGCKGRKVIWEARSPQGILESLDLDDSRLGNLKPDQVLNCYTCLSSRRRCMRKGPAWSARLWYTDGSKINVNSFRIWWTKSSKQKFGKTIYTTFLLNQEREKERNILIVSFYPFGNIYAIKIYFYFFSYLSLSHSEKFKALKTFKI